MNKKEFYRTVMRESLHKGPKPYFETPEALEARIQTYFDYCIENDEIPMVGGLALWLGMSRMSLYRYQHAKSEEMTEIVNRAKWIIEKEWSTMLADKGSPTGGLVFYLVNNAEGWKSKHEVQHSGAAPVTIVEDIDDKD